MPKKEGFFKKYGSRIKTWTNRFMSIASFGLVTASVVGVAIPAGVLIIPPSLAMVVTLLVKHGPKSLIEIKDHLSVKLKDDPEAMAEVIDCLSDMQSKFGSSNNTEPLSVRSFVNNTEPVQEATPVTPNDGNITERREVKVVFNDKTKRFEYIVE